MPKCPNCDGEDFELTDGQYFCTECHVQSQDLREIVVDEDEQDGQPQPPRQKIHRRRRSSDVSQLAASGNNNWSFYELYNIIIKKQSDALINMGANPMLRQAVFFLWARYLEGSNVALFKKRKVLPDFHFPFGICRRREAEINLKPGLALPKVKKTKKQRARIANLRKMARRLLYKKHGYAVKKKKKPKKKVASEAAADTAMDSDDFGYMSESSISSSLTMDTSMARGSKQVRIVKLTKCLSKIGRYYQKQGRRGIGSSCSQNVWHMKLSRTLSFLYLGVLLVNDHVLLYDIVRWVQQGHVPFNNVSQLVPDDMKLQKHESSLIRIATPITVKFIRRDTDKLAKLLGVKHIFGRHPHLVCARLIKELNLPSDLCGLTDVFISMRTCESKAKRTKSEFQPFPYYEGRAMAIIIVCLKILFGLNGITEIKLSNYARRMNENSEVKNFVWSDWVAFTNTRQSIAKFSLYNCNNTPDKIGLDSELGRFYVDESRNSKLQPSGKRTLTRMKSTSKVEEPLLGTMGSAVPAHRGPCQQEPPSSTSAALDVTRVLRQWDNLPSSVHGLPETRWKDMFKDFSNTSLGYILTLAGCGQEELQAFKRYEFNVCRMQNLMASKFTHCDYFANSLSYRWLINLCSNLLEITFDEMYHEVSYVENYIPTMQNLNRTL